MTWIWCKAYKTLCIQKVSLLLNLLFFLYLTLLYQNGFINKVEEADTSTSTTATTSNAATTTQYSAGGNGQPSIGILAGQQPDPPNSSSLPIIYLITPTYHRPSRKADFTRLAQTIRQVPNLHWIVVEDGLELCGSVKNVLQRLVTNYTYLIAPTPDYRQLGLSNTFNKGVYQRNIGLEWIRWRYKDLNGTQAPPRGVVYFADDDNTYDLRLFEMMRNIHLVGVWPVALVGGVKLEKPLLNQTTDKLISFDVGFAPNRIFAVDMAGFALGLRLVLSKRKGHFPLDTVRGWNEPALFDSMDLTYDDVQVLGLDVTTPDGLHEPLVWHTKTAEVRLSEEARYRKAHGGTQNSDDGWEV